MRLTSLADYAVVLMDAAQRHCGGVRSNATVLAAETGLPLPTVQKLVGRLARAGLIDSTRGTAGGIRLARPPAAISLIDIIEAVEGPVALTACSDHAPQDCAIHQHCAVKPHLRIVNHAIREALSGITLARLADDITQAPAAEPALETHA